jgi:hypothetical protein
VFICVHLWFSSAWLRLRRGGLLESHHPPWIVFCCCAAGNEQQNPRMIPLNRREFLKGAAVSAVAFTSHPTVAWSAAGDLEPIRAEVVKQHDDTVRRLQRWVHQPSIAAENRGVAEGCELTMALLREAGFQQATRVPTDGQPGIYATLDAGAARSVGLTRPARRPIRGSSRRKRPSCDGTASNRCFGPAARAPGPDLSSPARRYGCLPAISAWAMAAEPMHRTSIT